MKVAKEWISYLGYWQGMIHFHDAIAKVGYEQSMMLFRIPWDGPVDGALLETIIRFNMLEKAECKTFWR